MSDSKKYICSWSGGKDSTATIILAHLKNEPLDTIVFSEVMFNKEISGEDPKHIDFIMNKAKPLFESWGYKVIVLRSEKTYMDIFNHIIEHPRKHESHKGKKYGFAISSLCSVKRDLKLKPIENFYKSLGNEPYVQYVGICIDEPKRLNSLHKDSSKVSLLEKYKYTRAMTRALCEEYDLLSPSYGLSKRGGCWFCPNAKLEEHRQIKMLYPEVWSDFVMLENEPNLANDKWNVFGDSLRERDILLSKENKVISYLQLVS